MKNIVFKTKFDECKTLKEILDKINDTFFEKSSYYLLNLWILYPLLMMFITYRISNVLARNIMYYILIIVGMSGILIGTIYTLKKFYKKEKFNIKKYLPIIFGIVLLIWCIFTSFFSERISLSLFGEGYRREGLFTYFLYSGVLLLGIMLKNKKLLLKTFNNFLFVQIIVAIIALINNSFTYSLMNNQEPYTGIFSQFNHYGYYLMFGVLLSIFMFLDNNKLYKKILYLIIYGLLLYTLIMNDTFGSFLAIFVTFILIIIYYIFIKKKIKILIPIISIFILVSMCTYKYNQNVVCRNIKGLLVDLKIVNEVVKETKKVDKKNKNKKLYKINYIGTTRGTLWRYGFKYIGNSPIVGKGIESTYYLYPKDNINQSRPHNILIQFGIFTGIPGIILYILFIGSILIRNLKKIKILDNLNIFSLFIVVCYLISSMFGNSMFYTSPYFLIFLGIICKNAFYKKELT
ncbi:MAG: O-antigen ligase family protein [Lactobacillales bacterium]|nr:O-antigen ligase family protein [Lactobacillales bacterium]